MGRALIAQHLGGAADIPLWLRILTGVLMGYLIGGAVIWGVRIFGHSRSAREAMGLGDVHVPAAVGACPGWPDAVLTFFAAVPVGLLMAIVGACSGLRWRMMAFGPRLRWGRWSCCWASPDRGLGRGSDGPDRAFNLP